MNPKLLLPVFLSCFAVPASAQLSETPLPQEDASAIRAVWQEWCDAALAGDLDRFAGVYSDHAVEVFTSGQSNTSRANVAVRARPWFVNGTFTSCNNDIELLEGAGGTAFTVAANTQS
jgi:ketosteroid isomerase-like protein